MKGIKRAALLLMAAVMLVGCEKISHKPLSRGAENDGVYSENIPEKTEPPTDYIASVPEISQADVDMTIEAEECSLGGSLYVEKKRKGYSGKGYVTGFCGGSADYLIINADIPTSQHYDITVCAAANAEVSNDVLVNDENIGDYIVGKETKKFTQVTFYGVYMEKGTSYIQINKGSSEFDLDFIKIVNDKEIYNDKYEIDSKPVSEQSSYEARDLLRYLKQCRGECILTGQYASNSKNRELEKIHSKTGQYPVIRFGDIGGYAEGDPPLESEIQAAKDWDKKGGIVGFMWYWRSPGKRSSVYANDTKFDLSRAVTKKKIAELGISELTEMCKKGEITEECLALIKDIDSVSAGLKKLAEEGIPVLWRPLHEGGESWYWWGAKGPEAYKWLYELMFDRMTKYHKLDNLIWIWNGQSEESLVSADKYDIAAVDVYLDAGAKFGSRSEQFQWLKKITESKKLLALSECSSVPDIDEMLRDNSMWSFFGLWFGEYMGGDTDVDKGYTPTEELYKMYNAENSITLDKYAGSYSFQ